MSTTEANDKDSGRGLRIGLWVAQGLLALAFGMAGGMKLFVATDKSPVFSDMPWLIRFIGVSEVAGALGVILPAATRIAPVLTPIAAVGLAIIMVLAGAFHVQRGEISHLPPVLFLFAMSVFVAWGRFKKAPIAPR
jgi:uncharacterized membrane protein YphA (DoxX/SURF4 family)